MLCLFVYSGPCHRCSPLCLWEAATGTCSCASTQCCASACRRWRRWRSGWLVRRLAMPSCASQPPPQHCVSSQTVSTFIHPIYFVILAKSIPFCHSCQIWFPNLVHFCHSCKIRFISSLFPNLIHFVILPKSVPFCHSGQIWFILS